MAETASKEGTGKSVEFSVKSGDSEPRKRPSRGLSKHRSSFLHRMSQSFRRSSGDRGADVETLRGTHGADFEGVAVIQRGGIDGGCGCFGGKDTKEKLLLIKGPFCFVFHNEDDLAPKYAISLAHMKAKNQAQSLVVTLETNLGDTEYEISFVEEKSAKDFVFAVTQQAARGETEEVRKRLGHDHLLSKRASVRFAEKVALKKVEDQPEKVEKMTAEDMTRFNTVGGL